jgi:hypothetical protein
MNKGDIIGIYSQSSGSYTFIKLGAYHYHDDRTEILICNDANVESPNEIVKLWYNTAAKLDTRILLK